MKKLMFLLGIVFIGYGVSAQGKQPILKKKRAAKNLCVKQGKINGSLTKKEVKQLRRQKKNLNRTVRLAKADGVITKSERKQIARKNRKLDKSIYRKKHNAQFAVR